MVQQEYDKMEETFEVLLTHTASHLPQLEKEANEIIEVEVEEDEDEEAEEILMVNQTPRSMLLLDSEDDDLVVLELLLKEEENDLVGVVEEK